MCEALLSSSALAGQKHPSMLYRRCLKCRRYQGRLGLSMKIKSCIYICGHSGCAHSDVRSWETTIVEGPIERHISRLVLRETGDGLTATYSGGSLDRAESVLKWSRERRARPSLREASRRDKTVRSISLNHSLCPEMRLMFCNHINAQVLINFSGKMVRGKLYVTSTP